MFSIKVQPRPNNFFATIIKRTVTAVLKPHWNNQIKGKKKKDRTSFWTRLAESVNKKKNKKNKVRIRNIFNKKTAPSKVQRPSHFKTLKNSLLKLVMSNAGFSKDIRKKRRKTKKNTYSIQKFAKIFK